MDDANPTMLGQLWCAYKGMSRAFEAESDWLEPSLKNGCILALIEQYPGSSPDVLASLAFISAGSVEQALWTFMNMATWKPPQGKVGLRRKSAPALPNAPSVRATAKSKR